MAKHRKLESTGADRSDLRALLAAAKADHWDDGPRLAMADWLEENGGETDRARAEVIRLQLGEANGGPAWTLTVEKLREKHVRDWVPAHRDFFRQKLPVCERGLLVAPTRGSNWPIGDGPADESWEWMETARPASVRTSELPRLLGSQRMATVPALDLGHKELGSGGVRTLCKNLLPGIRRLRIGLLPGSLEELARRLPGGLEELAVTGYNHPVRCAVPLLRSAGLAGLRGLSLSLDLLDDEAALLASEPALAGLRRLSLQHSRLTAAGLRSVASLGLRRLRISEAQIGMAGLAGLADSPCRSALEELRLDRCELPGTLPGTLSLPRLRRLAVDWCGMSREGMVGLAGSGLLEGLAELSLSRYPVGPEGVAVLASVAQGPRSLRLENASLGDRGAERLAAWPGLASVRYLDLTSNRLGDAGVRVLAESAHAGAVEALGLAINAGLTPAGMSALLRSPLGSRLRWLSLDNPTTPPRMAEAFIHNPPANLRELRLGWATVRAIGGTGMARLRAALPQCAIG